MDDREHDATGPRQQRPGHQAPPGSKAEKRHAREAGDLPFMSRLEQAQAGDEGAQVFFYEALRRQDTAVQAFLEKLSDQGDATANLLLRGYYLSLLLRIRTGDADALDVLREQVLKQNFVAHELLLELTAREDQIALTVLRASYDCLLEQIWEGSTSSLAFFHGQLQHQNDEALAFLSERAAQDTRVCTMLLHPYYRLLVSQAVGDERNMAIFRRQLQRKDEVAQTFLIQQVGEGSDDAFRVLWEYYRPDIERHVRQLVLGASARLVEELTQAIFVKVWRSLPNRNDKEPKMQFRAWLYRVANSEVFDYFDSLKTRRARTAIPLIELSENASVPGPEDEVCEQDHLQALLREALLCLSERARKCVLMADVEGYSTQEIARELGIRQGTVTAYLSRSRAELRNYLQALNYRSGDTQQPSSESNKRHGKKRGTGEQDSNERGDSHE